jgi:histone deacetylase 6
MWYTSLVHTAPYLAWLDSLGKDGSPALPTDLFANAHTARAAKLSAGGLLALLDALRQGTIKNGFALSRPPGTP